MEAYSCCYQGRQGKVSQVKEGHQGHGVSQGGIGDVNTDRDNNRDSPGSICHDRIRCLEG